MVVKSATKKKLMDMLVPEEFAHKLADDRKWDDVKVLTAQEIAQFCETDSDTAARIHGIITGASASSRDSTVMLIQPQPRFDYAVELAAAVLQRLFKNWSHMTPKPN